MELQSELKVSTYRDGEICTILLYIDAVSILAVGKNAVGTR